MTDSYSAVIDRIVDGVRAVLLLEADGETVDELTVAVDRLPEPGRHEGAVFEVTVEDGSVVELEYRPGAETERRESAQERFDRLSERLDGE